MILGNKWAFAGNAMCLSFLQLITSNFGGNLPILEQRNPTSNFSSVLKLLSFALFNFLLFNILNSFGSKLLTAISSNMSVNSYM